MKKIAYVSGTRADYGLMKRTLKELAKNFDLTVIVTGMHLSKEWGNTKDEIEKDGFKIKIADMNPTGTGLNDMAKSLGEVIINITDVIEDIKPDLVLVEGDRGEALAGAIAASHMNIPVVHQGGGDLSGSIDNKIRYAITMFADYHLVGNQFSYKRLLDTGLDPKRLINVGEPGLDDISEGNYTPIDELTRRFDFDASKPLILLIFHPDTKELAELEKQVSSIVDALKELNMQTIGLYANADAGGRIINKALKDSQKDMPFLKMHKHFFREDFLGMMNACNVMVGNSSAGLIELPSFKKPFICIGNRQKNRLKADNVLEVPYNKDEIIKAIEKALNDKSFKGKLNTLINPYGDGNSNKKITKTIKNILK